MWFKNLAIYRLQTNNWAVTYGELEQKLAACSLMPCGAFDMRSRGWTLVGETGRYAHVVNGQFLLAFGVDEKVLPAAVVKQSLAERAKELAFNQGYPVGRRQMRELKMRVTEELRGLAMTRKKITHVWIDQANGWLVVDSGSFPRADEAVECLRDALGSLPVRVLETQHTPMAAMSSWLALGDAPSSFTLDDDIELRSPQKGQPTIRYKHHPVDGSMQSKVREGMFATRLGLTWKDRVAFVLTDRLQVKRVEFLLMGESKPTEADEVSAAEQFDADFALMTGEISALLADLVAILGGEIEAAEPSRSAA